MKLELNKVRDLEEKTVVSGTALLKQYTQNYTKNGAVYFSGLLAVSTHAISFKAWDNSAACNYLKDLVTDRAIVVALSATVSSYNGEKYLTLETLAKVEDENPLDYYPTKYNLDLLKDTCESYIKSKVSPQAFEIVKMVTDDYPKFYKEFAGSTKHDACLGGLAGHSLKLIRFLDKFDSYKALRGRLDMDLLYVAGFLHDIGKVIEYDYGAFQDVSVTGGMSHATLGLQILTQYKDRIVALKGERFYKKLCTVVVQHMGGFGEAPTIVESYIIHLFDDVESTLTKLDEAISSGQSKVPTNEGFNLTIPGLLDDKLENLL